MRTNGASKNSASSTAILNRSLCSSHEPSILALPIGEPMLATPMPWSASFVRISRRRSLGKSSTLSPPHPAELEVGDAVVPADADLVVELGPDLIGEGGEFQHGERSCGAPDNASSGGAVL
jgi:hypothetical protein